MSLTQEINYIIRTARPTDVTAMAAAQLDSLYTLASPFYSSEVMQELAKERDGRSFLPWFKEKQGTIFVAEQKPEKENVYILGFAYHHINPTTQQHGLGLYIRGDAKGTGLSEQLFRAAEQKAREAQTPTIALQALLGAVPFYKRMGMEEGNPVHHKLSNGAVLEVRHMVKNLDYKP